MVHSSKSGLPAFINAASRVDFDGAANVSMSDSSPSSSLPSSSAVNHRVSGDYELSIGERAVSAAGAAFVSAILVNPLDVAKTRLQAQAAGVPYYPPQQDFGRRLASLGPNAMLSEFRCSPSCTRSGLFGTEAICARDCFQYKGTFDVFYKVIRQEGIARLWRGTNAGLALAIPTVEETDYMCNDGRREFPQVFTSKRRWPEPKENVAKESINVKELNVHVSELARALAESIKMFKEGFTSSFTSSDAQGPKPKC